MSAASGSRPVVRVRDLGVYVGDTPLVQDVDLSVARGERVGLIGESGSGKSLTALSIMGLLPPGLRATGSIRLDRPEGSRKAGPGDEGIEIVGSDERSLSRVEVWSRPRFGDEWSFNAGGRVVAAQGAAPLPGNVPTVAAATDHDGAEIYRASTRAGLGYGPAFQRVTHLRRSGTWLDSALRAAPPIVSVRGAVCWD